MYFLSKFLIPLTIVLALFSVILFPLWKQRSTGKTSPIVDERLNFPGESLKARLSAMSDDVGIYLIFAFSSVAALITILPTDRAELSAVKLVTGVLCCLIILYAAWKLKNIISIALNYRLGLDGEEYTGQQLTLLLKDGADVFHDIPYKYGNIDHVVVGLDKVFVVETKAVRKPASTLLKNGKKNYEVEFDGERLIYPTFSTRKPVEQAMLHAKWMRQYLSDNVGVDVAVVPVVALPGWFVKSPNPTNTDVLVCNPKGGYLRSQLGKSSGGSNRTRCVESIQQLAKFGVAKSKITDPDANKHFDRWNRRIQKKSG